MAIHGVVVKKDGNVIEVVIGEEDDDPVVGVSIFLFTWLPIRWRKTFKGIEGEDLNICIGSIPIKVGNDGEKERVKKTYFAF